MAFFISSLSIAGTLLCAKFNVCNANPQMCVRISDDSNVVDVASGAAKLAKLLLFGVEGHISNEDGTVVVHFLRVSLCYSQSESLQLCSVEFQSLGHGLHMDEPHIGIHGLSILD